MKNSDDRLFFSLTRDFLDVYLPKQAGRSPHTVKAYRDALTIFRRYLYEQCNLSIARFRFVDCTRECVLDFLIHLETKGCSPGTCNHRLTAIKAYVWYASDIDITLQPTALAVSRVPLRRGVKEVKESLSEQELSEILNQPSNTKIGMRDRTIMILLYDSAIRLSELLGLRIGDLNMHTTNPYIRIHGKGDKERIVAITPRTAQHLQSYMGVYHKGTHDRMQYIFYTKIKGRIGPMSPGNVERFIKKYADEARKSCSSIPKNVYPHMFRRTRATDLYQSGVELELISRILGHSSTDTTRIYATPSLEMMREVMDAAEQPDTDEVPLWSGDEEEMARLCGLR